MRCLLVGTGYMGTEYAKGLVSHGIEFDVVGRSTKSIKAFENQVPIKVSEESLDTLSNLSSFEAALVCVPENQAPTVVETLIRGAVPRILVEKPGALLSSQLGKLASMAEDSGCELKVAFNRRFFRSVQTVRQALSDGVAEVWCLADITERAQLISASPQPDEVKARWAVANSIHIWDLLQYLVGEITVTKAQRSGQLNWHPTGSRFTFELESEGGTTGLAYADWSTPGRWTIELRTKRETWKLCPIETAMCFGHQSFEPLQVVAEPETDIKAGVHGMLENFLFERGSGLPQAAETTRLIATIEKAYGYVPL